MSELNMSEPDHPADAVLYAARLHPHRSLTPKQFHLLLALVGAVSAAASLPFIVMGAWPVAGFMGLDVLIVWLAFRASFRSARAYEDVRVTTIELVLAKVSARGARAEWRLNPSWVRLEKHRHEEFGMQRIDLVTGGRRVEVASFLGPDAKERVADDLGRALAEAKRGYRYG